MSRKTPHTCCTSGQRVYVETRDGGSFTDKFRRVDGNWRVFDNHRVHRGNIAMFSIVKGGRLNERNPKSRALAELEQ